MSAELRCAKFYVRFGGVVRCERRAVWEQTVDAGMGVEMTERRCRLHRLRNVIREVRIR